MERSWGDYVVSLLSLFVFDVTCGGPSCYLRTAEGHPSPWSHSTPAPAHAKMPVIKSVLEENTNYRSINVLLLNL